MRQISLYVKGREQDSRFGRHVYIEGSDPALDCPRMRLKTEIWVKAYLRRCAGEGVDAVLLRRGDSDAGAVYIKVGRLDGTASLFGPAPAGLEGAREERRFESSFTRQIVPEAEADTFLARQVEFDSDIWIVAVDDRQGRHFLDGWLTPP